MKADYLKKLKSFGHYCKWHKNCYCDPKLDYFCVLDEIHDLIKMVELTKPKNKKEIDDRICALENKIYTWYRNDANYNDDYYRVGI